MNRISEEELRSMLEDCLRQLDEAYDSPAYTTIGLNVYHRLLQDLRDARLLLRVT